MRTTDGTTTVSDGTTSIDVDDDTLIEGVMGRLDPASTDPATLTLLSTWT